MESINVAKAAKAHEEVAYGKFLRLRERYVSSPKKLSESIVAYQGYLEIRFQHYQDEMLSASLVTSGAFSFDEMMAAQKKIVMVLEEHERKLDIPLTE